MYESYKPIHRKIQLRNPRKRLQHGAASIRTTKHNLRRFKTSKERSNDEAFGQKIKSVTPSNTNKILKRKQDENKLKNQDLRNKVRKKNEDSGGIDEEVKEKTKEENIKLKKYIKELENKLENNRRKVFGDDKYLKTLEARMTRLRQQKQQQLSDIRIIEPQRRESTSVTEPNHNRQIELKKFEMMEHLMLNQTINQTVSQLSKFSGSKDEDFTVWFEDLRSILDQYPSTEATKITIFKSKLQGDARYTFEGFLPHKVDTLEKAGKAIETVFTTENDEHDWIIKLNAAKQTPSELIRVFGHRINRMVLKAYSGTDEKTINKLSIDYFLRGLSDNIGETISIMKPKTLESAIKQAIIRETKNQIKIKSKPEAITEKRNQKEENSLIQKQSLNSLQKDMKLLTCENKSIETYKNDFNNRFKQIHEKLNSIESKYLNSSTKDQEIQEKLNVLIEGQNRFDINNHIKFPLSNDQNYSNQYRTENRSSMICYHCNKRGHSYHTSFIFICYHASENDKLRLANNNLKEQGTFSGSQRTKKP